jgi:hypothetical protein
MSRAFSALFVDVADSWGVAQGVAPGRNGDRAVGASPAGGSPSSTALCSDDVHIVGGLPQRGPATATKKKVTFRQDRAEATADTFSHFPPRLAQPDVTALCMDNSSPLTTARASTS